MVHICKMIISSGFFFILSKNFFLGTLGGGGVMGKKGKKQSKMTKHCLSCSISQEPYIILVQMCRMIISPSVRVIKENYMSRHFFSFFKILIFQVVKGRKKGGGGRLKGQKMIWSSFMVNKCKKLIPLRAFLIF